jgi:hypothetical protein
MKAPTTLFWHTLANTPATNPIAAALINIAALTMLLLLQCALPNHFQFSLLNAGVH